MPEVVDCSIVQVDAESKIQLLGRVSSRVATRIRYCFIVARSTKAGETSLAEYGELDLLANQPTEFGHTHLDIWADSVLDARLVVKWDGGEIECGLAPAA